jgi:uncharacterized protein (TIGR02687 family)
VRYRYTIKKAVNRESKAREMDTKQIEQTLGRIFHEEEARIVFWNDPDREFENKVPFLDLGGVNLLRLDQIGQLEVKVILEKGDPVGKYLLYSPAEEPDFDDDWLLDIRLYSRSFRADRASILLDALGLTQQRLREHLALRRRFFDNSDCLKKLKGLVSPGDSEAELDRKMMAVACGADQPESFHIVRTLYHAQAEEGGDLETMPPAWEQMEKYDLDGPFWKMAADQFGYREESPNLKNLLIRMLASDFCQQAAGEGPAALRQLLLPEPGRANAVVFLALWRDSSSTASSYDTLSEAVAQILNIEVLARDMELDSLRDVMTFSDIERVVMQKIRDRVLAEAKHIDVEPIRELIRRRQDGYWVSGNVKDADVFPRHAARAVYRALEAAADIHALRNDYADEFPWADAGDLYRLYTERLFRFDQLYRHFRESARYAEAEGWGILKPLEEEIEAVYGNWYLTQLALEWGKCLDAGLLHSWRLKNVPKQQDFFETHVRPRLEESDRFRTFVIISDALRYEAAEELSTALNSAYRLQAELSTQLGVLPSYTGLGMASLLPGAKLAYREDGGITVDGEAVASSEQRNAALAQVQGIALKSDSLTGMNKTEGRKLIADRRVVYIYHNTIDAVGDSASTEENTFEAVRKAITELVDLTRYIVNHLNGNHVVITADHGFLYTAAAPSEIEKSRLAEKPGGTVTVKKRYLLGRNLGGNEAVWHGSAAQTAGADGDMEFWIPRGVNLFYFTGGARFVHGGAMPQEIVVPVITVKHLKDKAPREKTKTSKVAVNVLGAKHLITTGRHRFQLLQMEPVGERVKGITLKAAVYEGDEPVTNTKLITFDSPSKNMDDRQKNVFLVLKDRPYDKKTRYRLILRDADTDIEQVSVDVTIDRAIADDF